jgi:hypothetical protein
MDADAVMAVFPGRPSQPNETENSLNELSGSSANWPVSPPAAKAVNGFWNVRNSAFVLYSER